MKKFPYLLAVFFLFACAKRTEMLALVSSDTTIGCYDTLRIAGKVFCLDSISKKDFVEIQLNKEFSFEKEVIDDAKRVQRDSMKLRFKLDNGKEFQLVNDTTVAIENNIDRYVIYQYYKSYSDVNYWLVVASFYEGGGFLLVNKADGHQIYLWGEPIFSPDKKHFVSYSCDLEATYDPNGFQFFEVVNRNKVKLKWEKDILNWGPQDIKWKNDSTIYIEKMRIVEKDNSHKLSYLKMKIK